MRGSLAVVRKGEMAEGRMPGQDVEKGRWVRSRGDFFGFRARKLWKRMVWLSPSKSEERASVRAVEKGK